MAAALSIPGSAMTAALVAAAPISVDPVDLIVTRVMSRNDTERHSLRAVTSNVDLLDNSTVSIISAVVLVVREVVDGVSFVPFLGYLLIDELNGQIVVLVGAIVDGVEPGRVDLVVFHHLGNEAKMSRLHGTLTELLVATVPVSLLSTSVRVGQGNVAGGRG